MLYVMFNGIVHFSFFLLGELLLLSLFSSIFRFKSTEHKQVVMIEACRRIRGIEAGGAVTSAVQCSVYHTMHASHYSLVSGIGRSKAWRILIIPVFGAMVAFLFQSL